MKDHFPKPLLGKFLGNDEWELTAEFEYISDKYGKTIVPIGFVTNAASIPSWAQVIIGSPWSGRYAEAAVIHDWNYNKMKYKRRNCDLEFLIAMKICKVPAWKRYVMYLALRIGGWWFWN